MSDEARRSSSGVREVDILGMVQRLVPLLRVDYLTSDKCPVGGHSLDTKSLYAALRCMDARSSGRVRLVDLVREYMGTVVEAGAAVRRRTRSYLAVLWLVEHLVNGRWPTSLTEWDQVRQFQVPVVPEKKEEDLGYLEFLRAARSSCGMREVPLVDEIAWVDRNLLYEYDEMDASSCPSMGALAQLRWVRDGNESDWRRFYDVKRIRSVADKGVVDDGEIRTDGFMRRMGMDLS